MKKNWQILSTTDIEPIYGSLFDIKYNTGDVLLQESTIGYELTKKSLKIQVNIDKETNIENLIKSFKKVNNIDISIHDKSGIVFKIIHISITDNNKYSYKIKQHFNSEGLVHFEFKFKNIESYFEEL